MTELDEALDAAFKDRKYANFFYDTFLNTDVFFPALRADKKPGEWRKLARTERFFPLYLTRDESRAIPVFDTLEKLKLWADDKAFDYLDLPGHLLIKVIAPEIFLVLNEGTEHRYLFTPEVLEQLRSAAQVVEPN